MDDVVAIFKPAGKTPLEALEAYRTSNIELARVKMSYAGRLDPLAQGVLILLLGDACKRRDAYLNLDKSYEFTILLGIQTDTYDVLGLITGYKNETIVPTQNVKRIVNVFVDKNIGTHIYPYPVFSSKTVQGKPLFWWAKKHKLDQISIPEREMTVTAFELLETKTCTRNYLKNEVERQISSVSGDFRQAEVRKHWQNYFANHQTIKHFTTCTFSLKCSSGTYVRELTHLLGETLGTGALTIQIIRTSVGDFSLKNLKKP